MKTLYLAIISVALACAKGPTKIRPNAKVYVDAADGFNAYPAAALQKKHIPLVITTDKTKADYEIQAVSETATPQSAQGSDPASIAIVKIRSGDLLYACSVDRNNAIQGRQTAAESMAVYLESAMRGPETIFTKLKKVVSPAQGPAFDFR